MLWEKLQYYNETVWLTKKSEYIFQNNFVGSARGTYFTTVIYCRKKFTKCVSDGRYDTPHHPLFRSLNEEHSGDFYQPCEPGIKHNVGPRCQCYTTLHFAL